MSRLFLTLEYIIVGLTLIALLSMAGEPSPKLQASGRISWGRLLP